MDGLDSADGVVSAVGFPVRRPVEVRLEGNGR